MAADPGSILELLRDELRSAGYGGLVQEDELASSDRSSAQALHELLSRLQTAVVPAMHAHAASIRNLTPGATPSSRLLEPFPTPSDMPENADSDMLIRLDIGEADHIETRARELAKLLAELRDASADEG
jgi:hypothetical protein